MNNPLLTLLDTIGNSIPALLQQQKKEDEPLHASEKRELAHIRQCTRVNGKFSRRKADKPGEKKRTNAKKS